MHPADLDDTALARVRALEEQLGCPLVADEPRSERQRATTDTAPGAAPTERSEGVR